MTDGKAKEGGPYAVLAVTLPADCFADDDDICLKAGGHIAERLGEHLEANGHSIPDWVRGGCQEDWGVYLESAVQGQARLPDDGHSVSLQSRLLPQVVRWRAGPRHRRSAS